MSIALELLRSHTSASVVVLAAAAYGLLKYRRLQAWAAVIIGTVSTFGFVAMTIGVAGAVSIAAGWLDPGAVVSDLTTWGSTVWQAVGDTVVGAIKGGLP